MTNAQMVNSLVEGLKVNKVAFIKNEELAYMVANHSDLKTNIEWDEDQEAFCIELIDYVTKQYVLTHYIDDVYSVTATKQFASGKEVIEDYDYKTKAATTKKAKSYIADGYTWDEEYHTM